MKLKVVIVYGSYGQHIVLVNNCTDRVGCDLSAVPVRSDPSDKRWHGYFENDVPVSELRFFCNIYIILMLGSKGPKSGTINK